MSLMSELRRPTPPPDPKRHHYVPEMLQKRFVDDDGWLHAFSSKRADGKVYPVRPDKLFVEKHLYTETEADGSRNAEMERTMSRLEALADPVLERMVEAARRGRSPTLNAAELDVWCYFFATQWRRVPDLHRTITTDHEVNASLDALVADLRRTQPHLQDELDRLDTLEERRRMLHNVRVGVLESVSGEVIDALRGRGLAIGVVARPGKRFALGSRPVVKLTRPGATHISHPECELWLPIASDVVIGLGRGRNTETIVPVTGAQIRHLNSAAVSQSTVFASASVALTRSLARPR